ncbi:MAG TPA: hypothetical protein VG964_03345 [Candidatus Saccharimonadales bacterium]|nr:hypothetical protein [Candidatus Saccharimonadales bacterium]
MDGKNKVFNQLLDVSQDYLGPAAERFLNRQIEAHVHKDPQTIERSDIANLSDWIKLSFALLTKDTAIVEEYITRLSLIAQGKAKEALGEQWQQN